jgi:hypothetical protein
VSPDYGAAEVADIVAAALEAHTGQPAAAHASPAEVTSTPAAAVEPADPFVEFSAVSGRQVRVSWEVRLIMGRWEAAVSLADAVTAYVAAAGALRAAHYDVGPLGAPYVTDIAGQPNLVAPFTTHHLVRN